ncbi:rRNA pseudouridine synthase [Methylovirgula sp. 4M-Z18]|nr:rRNA pseudouridine synthase [Methylovirgula sp. 4M-Z18]
MPTYGKGGGKTGPKRKERATEGERPGRSFAKRDGERSFDAKRPPGKRGEYVAKRERAAEGERPARSFAKRDGERSFDAKRPPSKRGDYIAKSERTAEGERPAKSLAKRDGERSFGAKRAPSKRSDYIAKHERADKPRRDYAARKAQQQPRTFAREEGEERIAKVMARAGVASRRDAESWIAEGRVSINGVTLTSPAVNVKPEDKIVVDGKPIATRMRTRLFLFHKPRGTVTTARDPEGRPTIFDALPKDLPRLVTVGRLDINTEGLLLLTNDGGLKRVLELPETGWLRRYRVRANGETDQAQLDKLSEGVTIDGIHYAGIEARMDRQQGHNVWLTMGLREGKNREIKRVLEHLGLFVNRLIRLSFGPFQLGDLAEGATQEISTRILQEQLGEELAQEAKCDFDGPLELPKPIAELRPQREPPPERGGRERFARFQEEEAPRREKPERGKRKHISVLRAERRAEGAAPRKRMERTATEDRHGREVKVERVMLAQAPKRSQGGRNAERFAQERGARNKSAPKRGGKPGGGKRPPPKK